MTMPRVERENWSPGQEAAYIEAALLGIGLGPDGELTPKSIVAHMSEEALWYIPMPPGTDGKKRKDVFIRQLIDNDIIVAVPEKEPGKVHYALGLIGRVLVADNFHLLQQPA